MLYADFLEQLAALHENAMNALDEDLTEDARIHWEKLEGKLRSALDIANSK